MSMTQIYGDYIEKKGEIGEHLKIGFSPTCIPLQQRWRTNGLSADFLADYYSTFFPGKDPASAKRQAEMKDAVSYVANELLENAMKFSYAPFHHPINIDMYLEEAEIFLYVTNSANLNHMEDFQKFIHKLLTEDTEELYMAQLVNNASDEGSNSSGLGFLTMLNNYNTKLAWKFELLEQNADVMTVTSMVQLTV